MKFKRSKYVSILFLVSFFVSISTNICLASFIVPPTSVNTKTHDHLHLKEEVPASNINDLLFEENENENKNELDLDLSLVLIPYFLKTFSLQNTRDLLHDPFAFVASTKQPIYIQIANFRI